MQRFLLAFFVAAFAHGALAATPLTAHVATAKGDVPLKLEAVTQPAERERGLMERKTLAPYDGMLFVFPEVRHMAFWMKNTYLSLDIIFIDPKGTIVHIATSTTPLSEAPIDSVKPTLAVIELESGRAAAKGIAVGDTVTYTLPAGTHVE